LSDDPRQLHPDHLPTPFSAQEIHAGCAPGRTVRLLVGGGDSAPVVRVTRYVSTDAEGTDQESWLETEQGERISKPEHSRSTWLELQEHASFPASTTELAAEEIEVPAGRFGCRRYTASDGDVVRRFWFATDLPGMPIRMERLAAGTVVSSFALLENVAGG
jgi:hypothetical protein